MLKWIDILNLDDELKKKVIDLAQKDKVNLLSLADKCNSGNFSCLKFKSDLVRLAVAAFCLNDTKEQYDRLGISDNIFVDTMSDINIWCENNNNRGLKNIGWIKNHLSCEIFRLGRLQFQLYECKNPTLNYSKLPFKFGDRLIYIHIPQGERLDLSSCIESIKKANVFFKQFFPDFEYKYYFCESWLLYENNKDFMTESSNIIQFMSLFDIAYSIHYENQAIERIFGKKHRNINKYPESTTLQKNTKSYLQNGGKLGLGIGYIDKQKYEL